MPQTMQEPSNTDSYCYSVLFLCIESNLTVLSQQNCGIDTKFGGGCIALIL